MKEEEGGMVTATEVRNTSGSTLTRSSSIHSLMGENWMKPPVTMFPPVSWIKEEVEKEKLCVCVCV